METWRPVVGFEGYYEVSDLGRVRSLSRRMGSRWPGGMPLRGRVLKPNTVLGYKQVALVVNRKRIDRKVHQLVLEAFVSPRPEGMDACHNDGDRSNNVVSNLRWDTKAGNMADKRKHGTTHRHPGESCPTSKLKNADVLEIRSRRNERHSALAREFGVTQGNIRMIINNKTWKHLL